MGVTSTARVAAESAEGMIGVIARHLLAPQIFNVGIRYVFSAPLRENDARGYVLRRLLRTTEEDLQQLSPIPIRSGAA